MQHIKRAWNNSTCLCDNQMHSRFDCKDADRHMELRVRMQELPTPSGKHTEMCLQIGSFMKLFGESNQEEITHIILDAPRNGSLPPAALFSAIHNLKHLTHLCGIKINLELFEERAELRAISQEIVCALIDAEKQLPKGILLRVTGYQSRPQILKLWGRKKRDYENVPWWKRK